MNEQELEEIIGAEALLKLSEALGGKTGGKFVCVPEAPTCDNILNSILDAEAYEALTTYAGREWIYIPAGPARRDRNRKVLELSPTHTVGEIAQICGISERTVRHIARTRLGRKQSSKTA